MVAVFRRSVSFPNKNPNRPPKPSISHHIRSISLPCRSHPLISHLKDEITELKSLSLKFENRTSAWIIDCLKRLKDVHDSLDDILQLPQTRESLLRNSRNFWIENLLEDLLRFVDVYGNFQTSVLSLKEQQLAARVAVRKRDEAKIGSYVKERKKIAREIVKRVTVIRSIKQQYCNNQVDFTGGPVVVAIGDAELAGVIGDVMDVTSLVSVALFNGMYSAFGSRKPLWIRLGLRNRGLIKDGESMEEMIKLVDEKSLLGLKKKKDEEVKNILKRMEELEICMEEIEIESGRVFRSLINSRVSLLNTLTN